MIKGYYDDMRFRRKQAKLRRSIERCKRRWFTGDFLMGINWARIFVIFGPGDTGKSYWTMKWCLNRKLKNPDKVKFYWTRLTDEQIKPLLRDGAAELIDPDLVRKYDIHTQTNGPVVYKGHYEEHTTQHKDGSTSVKRKFIREYPLMQILPLSTFFNTKGVAKYDNEYDGEINIVLDEGARDSNGEKETFDIVDAFANQLENFCRDYKGKVRVFICGNNVGDSAILEAFNFIPTKPGLYKLKRRKCVMCILERSESYDKDRENSVAELVAPKSKRFSETTCPANLNTIAKAKDFRKAKREYLLCFSGDKLYEVYSGPYGYIIRKYNGNVKSINAQRLTVYAARPALCGITEFTVLYNKQVLDAIKTAYQSTDEALMYKSFADSVSFRNSMNTFLGKRK